MKKSIIVLAGLISLLSFSCQTEKTCKCTSDTGTINYQDVAKGTKDQQEIYCKAFENNTIQSCELLKAKENPNN